MTFQPPARNWLDGHAEGVSSRTRTHARQHGSAALYSRRARVLAARSVVPTARSSSRRPKYTVKQLAGVSSYTPPSTAHTLLTHRTDLTAHTQHSRTGVPHNQAFTTHNLRPNPKSQIPNLKPHARIHTHTHTQTPNSKPKPYTSHPPPRHTPKHLADTHAPTHPPIHPHSLQCGPSNPILTKPPTHTRPRPIPT